MRWERRWLARLGRGALAVGLVLWLAAALPARARAQAAGGWASWRAVAVAGVGQRLNGVAAPDARTAWIVGDVDTAAGSPVVLRTTDAGASWVRLDPVTTSRLLAVAVAGATVSAVGEGGTL